MITLKSYVCAFLEYGGSLLLMKRAADRELHPDCWSGVGGKMEAVEINDPRTACLREIHEETGIASHDVHDLTCRYIVLRRRKDVMSQSYIYFGTVTTDQVQDTDEGTLHWVSKEHVLEKTFTPTYAEMLKHVASPCADEQAVFVGIAEKRDNRLHMNWSKMEDFE